MEKVVITKVVPYSTEFPVEHFIQEMREEMIKEITKVIMDQNLYSYHVIDNPHLHDKVVHMVVYIGAEDTQFDNITINPTIHVGSRVEEKHRLWMDYEKAKNDKEIVKQELRDERLKDWDDF